MYQGELIFATSNPNKLQEVSFQLNGAVRIIGLKDIGCSDDLPETTGTIEGNSLQKASYLKNKYGYDCFAEDTGLEVFALNGAPGVDTAHYAGPQRSDDDNMDLLLKKLEGVDNRSARFRTVVSLLIGEGQWQFEGTVEGVITNGKTGVKGFGYDPVFQPVGFNKTFAEMDKSEKVKISHRGRAIEQLVNFLRNFNQ
ncbi:MAG: RdgB/HAM1 family non-canonical purine NTP pyrophosphatase [Chitinophagales bacterium]|nr:RdgB/HAM1 family non-canonical purine NTP pyrophosphatase [Chitinophagales bacterium]